MCYMLLFLCYSLGLVAYSPIVQEITEASSIKYNGLAAELKRKGISIISLSLGEAFFDIPLFSFEALHYPEAYHYSNSRGIEALRKKISDLYEKDHGIRIDPMTEIIITPGSKPGIYLALMSILSEGDQAIVLEPCWVSYADHIHLCNAECIGVPYTKTVFDVQNYITDKTRVIILNNPQNPSGKVYSKVELEHLMMLARRHNLYILYDEAYSEYTDDEPFYSIAGFDPDKKHSIVCNTMSKNFGISGFRIGFVITNAELAKYILKLNQHILTCTSTIIQQYVEMYFEDILSITRPQIHALIKKRKEVAKIIKNLGLEVMPGSGTFYFFLSIVPTQLSSEDFCMQLLTKKQISTTPGISYGKSCDKYIRIAIGTETVETIHRALVTIKEFIRETAT